MPANFISHPSSYRDPSGFIFTKNGQLYRQVNNSFRDDYDKFISSGCYDNLVKKGWLISHETISEKLTGDKNCYLTLKPATIPFISYPYEWCFDMLKDAALLTLSILKESLQSGMILKDASPYNIQWLNGRLVFIDSLSFENYDASKPWIAYRQFCEHFLSPLLLSHYAKSPLPELLLAYPDGIPLSVTSGLLPRRTRFSLHIYLHIHLNAKYAVKKKEVKEKTQSFSKQKLLNLINSLELTIKKLSPGDANSNWSGYYDEAAQRKDYLESKQEMVRRWILQQNASSIADLGANTGEFAKIAAALNIPVIAADIDAVCINTLYETVKRTKEKNILPLVMDLSKPSPAIGVNNDERASFTDRLQTNLVLALALIHHLAIGKNIPFDKIALFFQKVTNVLIIEFVPKSDEKVQEMLSAKKDIYTNYTSQEFESAFSQYFKIVLKEPIASSGRTLYLMKKNER